MTNAGHSPFACKNKPVQEGLQAISEKGHDEAKLQRIVERILKGEKLDQRHRDHPLVGVYNDCRECHVEPDWLLIYRMTDTEVILIRTGTHADLFE